MLAPTGALLTLGSIIPLLIVTWAEVTFIIVGSLTEGAKLVITDGTIDSNVLGTAVLAKNAGSVELTNVQVYAPSGVNPLQCYGGTMILNNVTTSQSGSVTNGSVWYNSAIQVINQIK